MKSYEVYKCRRAALDWTRLILAEKSKIKVEDIDRFENGLCVDKTIEDKIKSVINTGFKELDAIDHYKTRILELAYEIKYENDNRQMLYRISHMMIELGKLERETLDTLSIN